MVGWSLLVCSPRSNTHPSESKGCNIRALDVSLGKSQKSGISVIQREFNTIKSTVESVKTQISGVSNPLSPEFCMWTRRDSTTNRDAFVLIVALSDDLR